MMKIRNAFLCFIFLVIAAGPVFSATPEEDLKQDFPGLNFQSIRPSTIPGLFEVIADGRVIYYSQNAHSLVVGQIYSRDGKNVTQERFLELLAAKIKDLPLDKAIKIGEGKNTVIEFTDPDCSFCRKGFEFLKTRTDITKYVFFVPLPSHPDAVPKIRYVLCAQDKKAAYEEAMSGKLDEMKFKPCTDPKAEELFKLHEQVAAKMNINATPMFFINGTPVRGADTEAIQKLLERNAAKSEK